MKEMTVLEKQRWEFRCLIDRCGCSKAHLSFTKKEADEYNEMNGTKPGYALYLKPHGPLCTPHKCFPNLMKLLYPNGGFNKKSNMYHNETVWYERRVKKEEEAR